MCQAGLTEFTLGVKFTNFQTQPLTQRRGSNYPYQAALRGAPGRFRLLDWGGSIIQPEQRTGASLFAAGLPSYRGAGVSLSVPASFCVFHVFRCSISL